MRSCGTDVELYTHQAYASILALISVVATPAVNVTRHLTVILLTVWAVFAYRNLWPFATVSLSPMDAAEGPLLWAKLAVLTVAAVIVPLFIPRPYSPVDPKVTFLDFCMLCASNDIVVCPDRTHGPIHILNRPRRSYRS